MEKMFRWRQINGKDIPDKSGIYAWYYQIGIGKHDADKFVSTIKMLSEYEKKEFVSNFVLKNIFEYFEEPNYQVSLYGKLKPNYQGNLKHLQTVSDSIITKLINNPEFVYEIRNVLDVISNSFTSPLYIGMATNLKARLQQHKTLIERYKANPKLESFYADEETTNDNCFASRVVERGFVETNLYVVIKEIDDKESLNNVLENMLNRISYPILGRN